MTDYKTFFGLSKDPFAALASGNDVFVAPQVASAMAVIKKALTTADAVVAVSGPVGTGKTTIARRALESASKFHIIVTIGRIQFGHDEVLELLLAGLGVRQLPKSTVHRFATFRRVLQQYEEQQTRVFILIEDATRVGLDALSELEAVTAADAGVSGGANLILLGDENLPDFLRESRLARIKQRIRARPRIAPQSEDELRGYLNHCFRLASKEFNTIFADGSCAALHSLSDGIPRVANNLVMATLSAAAEQDLSKIDVPLIERIASDEFGLTGGHRVADIQDRIATESAPATPPEPEEEPLAELAPPAEEELTAAPELLADQEPSADLEPSAELNHPTDPEPLADLELPPDPEPSDSLESLADLEPSADLDPPVDLDLPNDPEPLPEPAFGRTVNDTGEVDDEIPELIQDTLPDLEILAPQLLPEAESQKLSDELVAPPAEAANESVDEAAEFDLPVLTGVFPDGLANGAGGAAAAEAATAEPILELAKAAIAEQESLPDATTEPGLAPESGPDQEPFSEPVPEPSPQPESGPEPEPEPEPVFGLEPESEPEPVPESEQMQPEIKADNSNGDNVPDWERDPTLAELRPDLDALERAMAVAQGTDEPDSPSVLEENLAEQDAAPAPDTAESEPEAEPAEHIPEITLDKQIQAKIEEATEALSQTQIDATADMDGAADSTTTDVPTPADSHEFAVSTQNADPTPAVELTPADATRADQELEKIASELAKAKTIEDVDDKMAETLFGEEFSMIAAQVAANAPPIGEETPVATGTPADEEPESVSLSLAPDSGDDTEIEAEPAEEQPDPMDTSSSQRLQALREINNSAPPPGAPPAPESTESIVMSGGGVELPPAKSTVAVDSIEDQISTSMTQTLKALNVNQMPQNDDSDDETAEKKGFFGLFRRK